MEQVVAELLVEQASGGESPNDPASEAAIAAVRESLLSELGAVYPTDLEALHRLTDGIDFDGLVVYGTAAAPETLGTDGFWQGLIAANEVWRDSAENSELLVIAENDMDVFTVSLGGREPIQRDRVTFEEVARFDSVASMLEGAIRERL